MLGLKRKWLFRVVFVLTAWSCIALGQSTTHEIASDDTSGRMNGRFWNKLTYGDKRMLVIGMAYGIRLAREALSGGEPWDRCSLSLVVFEPPAFSYRDVGDSMDKFFRDPANLNMPITDAYYLITARMSGGDKDAIERETLRRREAANRPHSN